MTTFPYLEPNLAALAKIRHPVWKWLVDAQVNLTRLSERLVRSGHGSLDFLDNGRALFNRHAPEEYYEEWVPETDDKSATIIVGSSLGYGINRYLTMTPPLHKVLVLEPRPAMLAAMLGLSDYSSQIRTGRLHFLLPDRDFLDMAMKRLSLQFVYGQIHFRMDRPSKSLGADYTHWGEMVRNQLEWFCAEQNTLHFKQDVMVENELQNFVGALSGGSLSLLKNEAHGLPAFILGAGPSLAQHADYIKNLHAGPLIVTSLQALTPVLNLGIRPHFCVAIDYDTSMLKILEHLDMEAARSLPLIYSTKVQPRLIESYPGPKIPMWTYGGMGTKILDGKEPIIDAGGNVGVAIRRLLGWLGCEQVILAGVDLAWKGKTIHLPGHHSSAKHSDLNPTLLRSVSDAHGNALSTSIQLLVAKHEMEKDIIDGGPQTVNLYGGGADLKGVPNVTPADIDNSNLLATDANQLIDFMNLMMKAASCRRHFRYTQQTPLWEKRMDIFLDKLTTAFSRTPLDQAATRATLKQMNRHLGCSPMFAPYFHKEIQELAEYTHARIELQPTDLQAIMTITDAVLKKIRFADDIIGNA